MSSASPSSMAILTRDSLYHQTLQERPPQIGGGSLPESEFVLYRQTLQERSPQIRGGDLPESEFVLYHQTLQERPLQIGGGGRPESEFSIDAAPKASLWSIHA